jgi:hypothetical protein
MAASVGSTHNHIITTNHNHMLRVGKFLNSQFQHKKYTFQGHGREPRPFYIYIYHNVHALVMPIFVPHGNDESCVTLE